MKINKLQLFLVIFTLVCPTTLLAISPPPIPSIPLLVYGNITIDGQPAPLDTEISAEINNVEVAIANIINKGIYLINIPDGKANEGKTIIFKVNGIIDDNNQLSAVNIDTIPTVNFDLAVTTSPSEEIPTPPASSGGGGGGGGATPPPTYKAGDANKDNEVIKYDFALIMAAWGKIGANNSDLNSDNKVDKYDFALLMLNWSTI